MSFCVSAKGLVEMPCRRIEIVFAKQVPQFVLRRGQPHVIGQRRS
jgi:hypothetical protein